MTRRERYLERRERYIRRGKAAAKRGRKWGFNGVRWVVVGRKWPIDRGPVQSDYLAPGADRPHGELGGGGGSGAVVTVTDATRSVPPHVKITVGGVPIQAVLGFHLSDAVAGYHRKPVKTCRWQSGRRSAAWRKDWGARTFAFYHGKWPDWDVHGRRPNESDVANGADPITFTQFPPPAVTGG